MSAELQKDDKQLSAAVRWFRLRRTGAMTKQDESGFETWLDDDIGNDMVLGEVEEAWAVLGAIEDDPSILNVRENVDRVLAGQARTRTMGVLAAGFAVALTGGWILTSAKVLPEFAWFKPAPAQEYRTTIGQRSSIPLADGSVVMLDTDSALRVQFTGGERRLMLERGQASFQVAKDRHRPFVVLAAGKTVRATGTMFDIRLEPGRLAVTLIEGRVRVQEQGAEREGAPLADMRAGWRLAIGEDARWRMEPVDLVKVTSWHDGTLTFDNDPLEYAVSEMNRYSQRKIVFSGPPPQVAVLGGFKAGDVESFARAMEMNKLARVTKRNHDAIELAAR